LRIGPHCSEVDVYIVEIHPGELDRRRRVVDVMVSAHARLRDRYHRRALVVDLAIFAGSTILCATVFVDPQLISSTSLSETGARGLLGGMSVLIFFLSIVAMLFEWKEAAGRHGRAAIVLGDLKAKGRLLAAGVQSGSPEAEEFVRLYDSLMPTLPPIPDDQFVKLKAYHRRKVELSQAIDHNPNAPVFVLRLKLRFDGIAAAFRTRSSRSVNGD
jgi:hypothetical protein